MGGPVRRWRSRDDLRRADGVLLVVREPPPAPPPSPGQPPMVPGNPAEGTEILLALCDDGQAVALHGHVDLGTGLRTALAQIVAEELDLAPEQVTVILGDTALAPNQGPTIASASIQIHAPPLQRAAAQARAWLRAEAAARWQADAATLATAGGTLIHPDGRRLAYGELLRGRHVELMLDANAALKPQAEHQVIGRSVPRLELRAMVTAAMTYVHDQRLPGMLHGRVVRPPYAGVDSGDFVGRSLASVDEGSIAHIAGIVKVVVIGDFIGIVAQREEQAESAMRALRVHWKPWPALPPLDDLAQALRANPARPRVVAEHGDVAAARVQAAQVMDRDYVWPYQMHAAIGPSCALAAWVEGAAEEGPRATVWAGTQNPHVLRADLARLTGLADSAVEVIRLEAAGCYGRNGADDVAADALLLSRAVGAPVRVQLSREQEFAWEPKGAAQLMTVRGGLMADGSPAAYDFSTSYPSNGATTLALLLTGVVEAKPQAFEMGDRTAVPPYAYAHQRITINDMAPILRASWLRGVSALPNSFAHESYIDELASAAGVDPVAYRLRHLRDERAAELLRATAAKAGWRLHSAPQQQPARAAQGDAPGPWLQGQGVAYARYVHSKFPGFGAAWAAWVADVEVNQQTGEVHVARVVVGHDAGLMVNPKGVLQQVHGNVLQTTSRALKERVELDPDTRAVASLEWGSYPVLSFREVPVVEVLMMPRPGEPPLGVGESASVPGTAAIANAIFDATGVRFRQPPFTPEVVRAALNPQALPEASPAPAAAAPQSSPKLTDPQRRRKPWWAVGVALAGGLLGLAAAALGWRPAIAPLATPIAAGLYSSAAIERGRALAALGNCAECHTAPGGPAYAGGRAMATPFGSVHSSNLTPDPETGIGRWSLAAFQRAMREGISRDGRHLYPAFPYTAFTQIGDDELTALYAFLMAQPARRAETPRNALAFPFNLRPLLALWNALYLTPGPAAAQPGRSAEWQRGAWLVNGPGHCGACHTPRNALGAEQRGSAYLGGAMAGGWEAPALSSLRRATVPWTLAELQHYLRQGYSRQHGVAGGAMASVVRNLATLPESDLAAMASYLLSLDGGAPAATEAAPAAAADAMAEQRAEQRAEQLQARSRAVAATLHNPAARMFESACGACHYDGDGPELLGLNLPLALNGNLRSARPDNLLRSIFDGIDDPAFIAIGHMPAFRHSLSDRQIAELAAYLRQRFAPDQPAWGQLPQAVARARLQGGVR